MWIVVGLGNPGKKYARTRHNAGFVVADEIAGRYAIDLKEKESYRIGKGSMGGEGIILLEPLTFMNRSGFAVAAVMKRHGALPENLIVIQDDIDMDTGRLKIRKRGSSGGHKGVESIIQTLGTREFIRVKIGVGRGDGVPVEEFVLGPFGKSEIPLMKDAVMRAADAVEVIVTDGVDKAMNRFN